MINVVDALVGDNSDIDDLSDGEENEINDYDGSTDEYTPPGSPEPDLTSIDSDDEAGPSTRVKGSNQRWISGDFKPDLVDFVSSDDNIDDREDWGPVDYVNQYITTDLMKTISSCTNAMYLANKGKNLDTTTSELYRIFGACIFMSVVPYPRVKMFWSNEF